ncbi:MAG: glycerol-3-phosphate dehydrogenase/oxidase [Pseudonocardia sp.]
MSNPDLTPSSRLCAYERLKQVTFDLLVVGGGVVGAGIALDAARRGLRIALVEAGDWASGASSQSTKLIHGGVGHLEALDFPLVWNALRERAIIANIAPHLVRPVPFLYPLTNRYWERSFAAAEFALYDALGSRRGIANKLPRHQHLGKGGTRRRAPGLDYSKVVGAVQYWDYRTDDSRYTLELVRTAKQYGATCISRTRMERMHRDDGTVTGADVTDLESGLEYRIGAKLVITSTGAWTNGVLQRSGIDSAVQVRPSKGVHLVVRRRAIRSSCALLLRAGSGAWKNQACTLAVPWRSRWLIGCTDSDWLEPEDPTRPTVEEIRLLLSRANQLLLQPILESDVVGSYAGLRPLVSTGAGITTRLSRNHDVSSPCRGLIVVLGGKYTTYRYMAQETVDLAVRALGFDPLPASTDTLRLVGADGYIDLWNSRVKLAKAYQISVEQVECLIATYGILAAQVLEILQADRSLAEPLGAGAHIKAEVVYAAEREGALHLEDVLDRRLSVSTEFPDRGPAVADTAAAVMGATLDWDSDRQESEARAYRQAMLVHAGATFRPIAARPPS